MELKILKVTREIDLAQYAPEYEGVKIVTWVNPPVNMLEAHDLAMNTHTEMLVKAESEEAFQQGAKNLEGYLVEFFTQLWSQGPDAETHWTVDEMRTFCGEANATDPQLVQWLRQQSLDAIRDHRLTIKKN